MNLDPDESLASDTEINPIPNSGGRQDNILIDNPGCKASAAVEIPSEDPELALPPVGGRADWEDAFDRCY